MVDISVNKGQGLISAIKTKLSAENIDTSNITWNVWTKILEQVKTENENNKVNGKELIYHKDSNVNGNSKENFVVFQGIIKFSEELWSNICKLVKGETTTPQQLQQQEQSVINQQSSSDIDFQNRNNAQKAISTIIQNLENIELPPNVDRTKINGALIKLKQQGFEIPLQRVSIGDMTTSLLVDLLKELMSNASEEEINYYAIKNGAKFVPNDTIGGLKCSEIVNNDDLIRGMTKGTIIQQTPPNQPIQELQQVPLEVLKPNVEKAVVLLKSEIINLSEDDLCDLSLTADDRAKILSFLNNISYDDDTNGAAKAVNNGIVFSTYCQNSENLANMVALLMHETNHCIGHVSYGDNRPPNSKNEERECESLAMLTVAKLIQKGKLPGYENYQRYSVPVTQYLENRELLSLDMNDWLTKNYSELPNAVAWDFNEKRWIEKEKDDR